MYKKIFSIFVMSCCFLSGLISAGDNAGQGFLGLGQYRGRSIPVYANFASAPVAGEHGIYHRSMRGDSILLYGSGEDAQGMIAIITPLALYRNFIVATIGSMCVTSAIAYLLNKKYKKEINIKTTAAVTGGSVLVLMSLYYKIWNPHIIFSATYS